MATMTIITGTKHGYHDNNHGTKHGYHDNNHGVQTTGIALTTNAFSEYFIQK